MPALNPQFTDEEMEDLRDAADRGGRSLQVVAHDLVVEAVSSRKHLVEDAAARIAGISAGPNKRLAEK